jgi:hypothetical protein
MLYMCVQRLSAHCHWVKVKVIHMNVAFASLFLAQPHTVGGPKLELRIVKFYLVQPRYMKLFFSLIFACGSGGSGVRPASTPPSKCVGTPGDNGILCTNNMYVEHMLRNRCTLCTALSPSTASFYALAHGKAHGNAHICTYMHHLYMCRAMHM